MSTTQDFVALEWIRGELANTLQNAQVALETVAEFPEDTASMRSCLTAIHQVHGTLKMVQLDGPTRVAAEMEQIAQSLMNSAVPEVELAQETLMQAILQLPAYLDRLHREHRDSEQNYLPMVNNLRRARGEERLPGSEGEEVEATGPDLELLTSMPTDDVVHAYFQAGGEGNLPKIRARYQQALAAIFKKNNVRENLTTIGKLFNLLIRLCGKSPMGHLAELGMGVIEGIASGGIRLDKTSAGALRAIDGELQRLAEAGQEGLSTPIGEELGRWLIELINDATKETARIAELRVRYASEAIEPEEVAIGPDEETMSAVAKILIEELTSVTDKLDLYVRSRDRNVADLAGLLPNFEQISSIMVVLGNTEQQQMIADQIEMIRGIEESGELEEDTLMLMAQSLLQIEASLATLVTDGEGGEGDGFADLDEAKAALVRETRIGLAAGQDAVIDFISSDFDHARLEKLPDDLLALRGSLAIVNQQRAGDVLESAANYVRHGLLAGGVSPDLQQMDDLADAITSVDYYLERLLENAGDPYLQMLEVAEASVKKLEFPAGQEVLIPQAAAETAIEPEPVVEDIEVEEAAPEPEPTGEAAYGDEIVDEEIQQIFIEEAEEVVETMNEFLAQWQDDPGNGDALSEVRRAFHTLKGSGRMVGATVVGELAWSIENLLNRVMDNTVEPNAAVMDIVSEVVARVPEGVEAFKDGEQHRFKPEAMVEVAEALAEGRDPVDQAPAEIEFEEKELEDDFASEMEMLEELELEQAIDTAEAAVTEIAGSLEGGDLELEDIFAIEAEEKLQVIDDFVAAPGEVTSDLVAAFHTLKGSSAMAEINSINVISAPLEQLTNDYLLKNQAADDLLVGLARDAAGLIRDVLSDISGNREEIEGTSALLARVTGEAGDVEESSFNFDRIILLSEANIAADGWQELDALDLTVEAVPVAGEETVDPASAVSELPEDDVDEDILPIFLEESDDLVEELEAGIQSWGESPDNLETLDILLRNLHTLKGGARMAGLNSLGEYAHNFEAFLIGIQQNPIEFDDEFFAQLNQRQDEVIRRVEIYKALSVGAASEEDLASMRHALEPGLESVAAESLTTESLTTESLATDAAEVEGTGNEETAQPGKGAAASTTSAEMIRVSADLIEHLISLAGESSITRGRVEQQISDFGESLQEMEQTINRIRNQVRQLEIEAESRETLVTTPQSTGEDSSFDELEMDRYTMLQAVSRVLNEASSDMMDLKDTLMNRSRDAEALLHQQARISGELQEGLTRTRMVPFTRLIPRLRGIVRQVSAEVGKSVRFDAYNVEGELDRNVLERIVAPLEHLLRNAVDHGIEGANDRAAAGKPEQGRISFRLSREGGYVLLNVSDDGGGINVDAVRKKAVERGLIADGQDVSDHEVMQFIMHAGFSTAQKLTQISGRGIGMDVVASEIKSLGGSITIDSTLGVGSEFTIRIPFTVSINRALMVVVREEVYAVPLNTIEGIVRVSPYELETYYQPDAPMFEYAGQPYRLAYMGRMLDKSENPNLEGQVAPLPVILARSGDESFALQVDRVIGSREVVVKTLGSQFDDVGGISGATVLGDGSVVIILDCMALVRTFEERAGTAEIEPAEEAGTPASHVRTVMIVDDSVTVRKVTSRLMERHGFEVVTAKDGVDAMEQLQDVRPDVVLLDIEMPRMDGFEVLRSIRRDEAIKDLPIIMITSRTGEKHKQQAMELGVNEYLGKPFQEASLLSTIESVIDAATSKPQQG